MKGKTLIIDLADFYGGGQKFVSIFYEFSKIVRIPLYAIVVSKVLYDKLGPDANFLSGQGFLSQIKYINEFVSENNIDNIILNGNRAIYMAPFIQCKNKIAYKHTSNNAFVGVRQLIGPVLNNFSYLFCHKIVLLFEGARKEVFAVNRKKVSIIQNGMVLRDAFVRPKEVNKGKIVFGAVSRIEKNKGIDWLVNSFAQEYGNNFATELRIAGSGPDLEALKSRIQDLKVFNIILEGFRDDIDQFLFDIDVLILPSKFESFPISILEGMNAGLPIIATNTGGVSELVENGWNGVLIAYGDTQSLLRAISELKDNESFRLQWGINSRASVINKFDVETQMKKILNLLK